MENGDLNRLIEGLGRQALEQVQIRKLQLMLEPVLASNRFYGRKLREAGVQRPEDVRSFKDLRRLPFTSQEELSNDQIANPPHGTNLTFPMTDYTHIHQTSGTRGEPLRCLDTRESWSWWTRCWTTVYRAAGVTPLDRIFFAFSFGPYIGFWSGYDGAKEIGALAVPGGGMSSLQRVKAILDYDISVLVCTPSYALHLADVAEQENLDIANSSVRVTIHAGEPGAGIAATKNRIERAWGARCYDHAGATEVGAWGFECQAQTGLHLNEGEFIFEVVGPGTGEPADEGELVVTNLGRTGFPVIRYRTGDQVKLAESHCKCGRTYRHLQSGIRGRVDDVLIIRGVNVFPSAIEDCVRRFPEVKEFAVDVYREGALDEMDLSIEVLGNDRERTAAAIAKELRNGLGLRVTVKPVAYGTLPRFDLSAERFVDHRQESGEETRGHSVESASSAVNR